MKLFELRPDVTSSKTTSGFKLTPDFIKKINDSINSKSSVVPKTALESDGAWIEWLKESKW